jgi:hypothetical protein
MKSVASGNSVKKRATTPQKGKNSESHQKKPQNTEDKMQLSQTLLESFPGAAFLMQPHTYKIVATNRFAAQTGPASGKLCYSCWAKRESPCTFCLASSVWETGKPQHVEVEEDGTFLSAHWVPINEEVYLHFEIGRAHV